MPSHPMRRRVVASLAALSLVSLAACSAEGGEGGDDAVSIGLIAAEQGNFAFAGTSYLKGAELAAEQVNDDDALGDGRTLELEVAEGSEDPQTSITSFNQLTSGDGVSGVICCISSAVAGAMKPIATSKKVPLVVYGATTPGLEDPPYVLRPALLPQQGIAPTAGELVEALGVKSAVHMAVVDNDGLLAQMEAAREASTAAGAEDLGVVETMIADTDFSGAVTQALAKKPEMITVYLLGEQAATVVKSLRERGYKGVILANNAVASEQNLDSFGATLADTYYSVEYFPTSDREAANDFTEAYQEKYDEVPDLFASQGFVAVKYVAEAIAEVDGDVTPEALGEALAGIETLEGSVWGDLTFEEGQAVSEDFQIVKLDAEGQPALWESAE